MAVCMLMFWHLNVESTSEFSKHWHCGREGLSRCLLLQSCLGAILLNLSLVLEGTPSMEMMIADVPLKQPGSDWREVFLLVV